MYKQPRLKNPLLKDHRIQTNNLARRQIAAITSPALDYRLPLSDALDLFEVQLQRPSSGSPAMHGLGRNEARKANHQAIVAEKKRMEPPTESRGVF
ncbi:hypothetical protein E2562_006970 [Oryza meyeriana var. granulata]|uniref:Uncharacterized protein n=1 Tax=Oryza meyeriana var. granulata TaxID=110450 RepID=A0A6G1E9Q6_9ORYZ|nr:hypothetical protein E2562_006970 [Oryza meyeriana var. granulata]